MSISKKLRFEVFKRDGFTCGYCGKTPPEVLLEIDHIIPKAEGGIDDLNNLLTACFNCNRGKSKTALDILPSNTIENLKILKEKQKQTKLYYEVVKQIEEQKELDLQEIGYHFFNYFQKTKKTHNKYIFAGNWKTNIKTFLKIFNKFQIKEAIDIAVMRLSSKNRCDEQNTFKYMCGILWNWKRGNG